jgi:dTDP-4-dehydrorhamnose 3,5-epimerase-like enzyme
MDRIELGPRSSVVQIPIGVWHDFVVLERNTAVLEKLQLPARPRSENDTEESRHTAVVG